MNQKASDSTTLPDDVIALLRCPLTGQALAPASAGLLARAKQMAHAGKLATAEQKAVKHVDGLLVSTDGENGYRADGDTWMLAPADVVPMHQLHRAAELAARKQRREQSVDNAKNTRQRAAARARKRVD